MPDESRWARVLRAVIDLVTVGTAVAFIASYFPADVMFSVTTTNGGDMGSHYFPALYLKDVLLPKGQVAGWCPGNYCGYPLFQFYFPLPFLIMAGVGHLIPFPIAFKLGTVLGTFLLPPCAYLGLRLLDVPFPGPAIGSLSTLCFLFMEANSMWGGNIPSTLAGEFSLSLSLALAVLFFGTLHRAVKTGRGVAWNGLLEALIGLSHGYTLLWVGFSSLLELIATQRWWRRVAVLAGVHALAISLFAFWLLPMIAYSPWTTAYNDSWPITFWHDVLPPILRAPAIAAAASALVVATSCVVRGRPLPSGLVVLWGTMTVAAFLYFTAYSFGVVDIRFVPFVQLGLCLAAGAGLGHLLGMLPAAEVWPVVTALAVLPFVQRQVTFIPSWIRWNYSGFERKATWPILHGLAERLKGDYRDPRVVYEHSPATESLGTVRAFEDLPLFSGRSTLEGLYMQSSPTAPFVFYIQSEISEAQSCPFPDWGCARFDLDRGLEHLRMFNVSEFIVRSDKVKRAAASNPGLEREALVAPYEIYRVRGNSGHYAVPLESAPYLILTRRWKELSYRWFKRARPGDVVPVFAEAVSPEEARGFAGTASELPPEMTRRPFSDVPALSETMDAPDHLTITGCRPGHPVLIRISYHPRWRALTGEKVWLAGPSFMLVFPRGERVELAFGDGPPCRFGRWLTWIGALAFLSSVLPVPRRLLQRRLLALGEAIVAAPPARWLVVPLRRTAAWGSGRRRLMLAVALLAATTTLGVVTALKRKVPADQVFREGQALFNEGKLDAARPYFQEVQRLAPQATVAIHAGYFEALTYLREQRWKEAEAAFARVVANFPEGLNAPESLYHVGLCRWQQGDVEGAVHAWEETRARFPESTWARYAADRLAEAKR
jgi:hypothetical protein